jgi:tripartite-type tricarboxylate transporter receptor subunit TctC
MRTQKLTAVIALSTLLLAVVAAQAAQPAWPEKPIRLVVGSAAGSGPDIISRVMADRLYRAWGQRIVVDPRPGVAGLLSAELVLRSVPDGYTWMMMTSQLSIATGVYSNHKVDLARDFASISLIGTVPFVLVVNPSVARTLPELIDAAKKAPGTLRYGSAGAGGAEHLCGFLLGHLTGSNFLHVPYKGIPQAVADTVAREVHFSNAVLPVSLPFVQSGRLRALGVTSAKRAALLPDVPAIAESVPGYELFGWYSLVAPTGTPAAVLAKASAEVVLAVKEPQFAEQLKSLGIELVGNTRAEFDTFRLNESKRMGEIVKASGVDLK